MSTKTARKRIGNGEKQWNGEVRIVRFQSGHLNHRRRLEPLTAGLIISAQEVSEALALIENTPVLLTCPLLESMPLHLWELAAQARDVGGIPRTIEPLEHQSHIFALGT